MRKLFYLSLLALVLVFVFSCKKDTTTPNVPPVISYGSFTMTDANNAILTFNFSDADGDIGLQPSDTSGPYATGTVGYNDFYMHFYYKNSAGNWVQNYFPYPKQPLHSPIDSSIVADRIPYIDNTSKVKALSGEIIIPMFEYKPVPQYPGGVAGPDTLNHFKYEFWIYDRAGHKSNVITTPEFDTSP